MDMEKCGVYGFYNIKRLVFRTISACAELLVVFISCNRYFCSVHLIAVVNDDSNAKHCI